MKKEKKDNYVARLTKSFEAYLQGELDVLEIVDNYDIIYDYVREFERRVRRYIKSHNPKPKKKIKELPDDVRKQFIEYGKKYLRGVVRILKGKSSLYSPIDGSVPEDIGELLKKLSREFS